MKKLKLFLLILFYTAINKNAWAYDAQIDGIYYNFSGSEATVTYKSYYINRGSLYTNLTTLDQL